MFLLLKPAHGSFGLAYLYRINLDLHFIRGFVHEYCVCVIALLYVNISVAPSKRDKLTAFLKGVGACRKGSCKKAMTTSFSCQDALGINEQSQEILLYNDTVYRQHRCS